MRAWIGILVLAGCSDESDVQLFAVRAMGGEWTVIEQPGCGTTIETPNEPYELVHVTYRSTGAGYSVRSYQAAPEDGLRFSSGNCDPPTARVPVAVTGASGFEVSIGPYPSGHALGIHDIVATASTPTPQFVIERSQRVTGSGVAVDFEEDGDALEPLIVQNTDGELIGLATTLVTAGGTVHDISLSQSSSAWVIPESALIEGDRQTARAHMLFSIESSATVEIDVRAFAERELTLEPAPPIDSVERTAAGVAIMTTGVFDEYTVRDHEIASCDDPCEGGWVHTRKPGWPAAPMTGTVELPFPDVTGIPDWRWGRPAASTRQVHTAAELCAHDGPFVRCVSANVTD